MFECVNRFGAIEQEVEVLGDALPVLGERMGRLTGGQGTEQRGREPRMLLVGQPPALLQRVAQLHQFFDAGDDAVLFGKGRQRNQHLRKLGTRYFFEGCS